MADRNNPLAEFAAANEPALLADWLVQLKQPGKSAGGRLKDAELQTQCRDVLAALTPTP